MSGNSSRLKDLTLTSVLVAFIIAQNYILYLIPFTLTYVTLYIMVRKTKTISLSFLAVITFVIVKNIIHIAFPTTIIFDLLGLCLFVAVSRIKSKWQRYIMLVVVIFFHLLMLDFSVAILTANVFETFIAYLITGFPVYIYAPLSIILIAALDGIEILTEFKDEENNEIK